MLPHQQRVVDEKAELDLKIEKLDKFLDSENSENIPQKELKILVMQSMAMQNYSLILGARITAFT